MLQLHRYFKESHSQYLPLDSPSWISPSSLQLGTVGCGDVQGVPWGWASPERAAGSRGAGTGPSWAGNQLLPCLGVLAGAGTQPRAAGLDVPRARGCFSPHPAPRKARSAGKGQAQHREPRPSTDPRPNTDPRPSPETPAKGRGCPHSQLWGL